MIKNVFLDVPIPALLWGEPSDQIYLYIHGQNGDKEEAQAFSEIVCADGWQVLSIDLPMHGERSSENIPLDPWHVIPELQQVMEIIKKQWNTIALYANSIGAWFAMLSYSKEKLKQCLFISPILDLHDVTLRMMNWANVSETQLKIEKQINTSFGQTLSWDYLIYVRNHPITVWKQKTFILFGELDHMTSKEIIENFKQKFSCNITYLNGGEHYFHTPQQLKFLDHWIQKYYQ